MIVFLAELLDCYVSDRVSTATDLSKLEPPSKKRKTGEFSSENEGGVDDSWSNDDEWTDFFESDWVSKFEELCSDFRLTDIGSPPSSENEGWVDVSRSNGEIWMPHKLESNGSLDREDNHDNHASSENEDRLLDCRSYDDQLLKLNTLPVSSTEISEERNEINCIEGSCEVHPVAGKLPVRHPNDVQLLSASLSNSDCLDDISWMDGCHPSPLVLLMRPGEVLLRPFFWNSKQKMRFLWRINDRLQLRDPAPDPDLLEELESNEPPIFNGNWIDKIDPKFEANIHQRGDKYDYSSVRELLRFVRNKYVHFLELPRKIKKILGWTDESFYDYFAARFPRLLMNSYGAASQFCREERWFKELHGSEVAMPSDPSAAW